MSQKRVLFSQIVANQLPLYVREEFPLIEQFLKQYYISQEFQGSVVDLVENIDRYLRIANETHLVDNTELTQDVSIFDDVVYVNSTEGFPDSYGLIQIDDEIITYTNKTLTSLTGCVRGFSGIQSLGVETSSNQIIFSETEVAEHSTGASVTNLSILFLKEFLLQKKKEILPGLENRELYSGINSELFITQSKDFYTTRGTDQSFKILFKALYGEKVKVLKPREQMISPSNANYTITNDFIIEVLSGNPFDLINQTLYQDEYGDITKAYAPITNVEKIFSEAGDYYKISIDAGYNRDITVNGATYGNFSVHAKTKNIGNVSIGSSVLTVDSTIGFPSSGELRIIYDSGNTGIVTYTSKSINQFFGCSGVTEIISDDNDLNINTYAYAKVGSSEIRVQLRAVLSDLKILDDTYYTEKGEIVQIKTLGENSSDEVSKTFLVNASVKYEIKSLSIQNISNNTYKVDLYSNHIFRKGDSISLYGSSSTVISGQIVDILSDTSVVVQSIPNLSLTTTYFIQRNISKVNDISVNVQNVYKDGNKTLVASPSIPSYAIGINSSITPQKLLREISEPINDGGEYLTPIGPTGILANGVEILNYKSLDVVYYGSINKIDILASGEDYDVINPPALTISDTTGIGASAYCSVSGSLKEIQIVDPGYNYVETPVIKITGGNGIGAKAYANMKLVVHEVSFNSESSSFVQPNSIIGFSTYHKFQNAERVIYKTNSQLDLGGLVDLSSYYVSVKSPLTVSLHENETDAISGINTVSITSFGKGIHFLQSYNQKSILESINIENSGTGYEDKLRTVYSSGISTSQNTINIPNHDYKSGEIVTYTAVNPIPELTSGNSYYVTTVDQNSFRLSEIDINGGDFYYKTNQYINFSSTGSGIHEFNYPSINVEIIGRIGISSVYTETFEAKLQPIFRGEITSVHVADGGSNYGSVDTLNYDKQPLFTLNSGSGAQITPIIVNGSIKDVIINQAGDGYNSPPKLVITGSGYGAVLTPIIENGKIKQIKVIDGGIGYFPQSTSILVISSGKSASFNAEIQKWTVNEFAKNYSNISSDDGFVYEGINKNYGYEYVHLYAARKLRDLVYAKTQDNKPVYFQSDLKNDSFGVTLYHSPIIGWAYDGNPIYGPYGYSKKQGGAVTQLKSGYILNPSSIRPNFPIGYFVEDYEYQKVNDESVLDEHNGRFCITPEFPNGTYAYFATFETNITSDSNDPFVGFKKPVFPFLIGNSYKSKSNDFNTDPLSNQDDIDLNKTNWLRNTFFYNFLDSYSYYNYVNLPNGLNQTATIKFSSPGSITNIGIATGGFNYKVNDGIDFNTQGTFGYGISARVSKVQGKPVNQISVASSTVYNVELYAGNSKNTILAIADNPHQFNNQDVISISGVGTKFSQFSEFYNIKVSGSTLSLASSISDASTTGIVTYFPVKGNISFRENDVLGIGTEQIKVLNVDYSSSRIRVLRAINGSDSYHYDTEILYEIPRKLSFTNSKVINIPSNKTNQEYYFNPADSLCLGNTGIGNTIIFSNPGVGVTQIFAPLKSIYLPNHSLNTGDQLVYNNQGNSSIQVSITGSDIFDLANGSSVYVAKLSSDFIGISTVPIGIGSTGSFVGIASTQRNQSTLYFKNIGSGLNHSFKTNYDVLKADISRNLVTVSTAQTHGLIDNDTVFVNVISGISTYIKIKYDDYNRKLLVNPKSFSSVGINTTNYTVTIGNHGFANGQKLLYTSSTVCQGLNNEDIYYAIVINSNQIQLANTYYNALNNIAVSILSSADGILSAINPPLSVYKDSKVVFDLSDSSLSFTKNSNTYSAFSLDFYLDENFTESFEGNDQNRFFEVSRTGSVGIDNNANVTLGITTYVPNKLYYKLTPLYQSIIPIEKSEVNIDSEVISHNSIQILDSKYNGSYNITVESSTEFTYSIAEPPELDSYSSTIEYTTNSTTVFGSIAEIEITNKGKNFYSLPGINSVRSFTGYNALLNCESNAIGKVKKTIINDIGYDFSSDSTLRPSASLPQILKIAPLASFDRIDIVSYGRGYLNSPKLVVIDGKTNQVIPEVDLRYNSGDTQVTILKNTYGINNVPPIIIPTQNSNGVGISSVTFNNITQDVTLTLSSEFSTLESFPFIVGDKILVENISVGTASTGTGYNSSDYNYNLFTVKSITPNIGGANPHITYGLSDVLSSGKVPGTFDPATSSGRVIPQKYFPIFNVLLKKNDFLEGEEVTSLSTNGYVMKWHNTTDSLTVTSRNDFVVGETVEGVVSHTKGIISSAAQFKSYFDVAPYSRVESGWKTRVGFLNDNIQRIQDSDYYQNFSYSLDSRVTYDKWQNVVETLNHTAGFKKFADYELETSLLYNNQPSSEKNGNSNALVIGLTTSLTSCDVTTELESFIDLNCYYDFDLVKENSLINGPYVISDEITFSSRILTDYFESVGNRVLLIDDISSQFNNQPRSTRYSDVYRFSLDSARSQKYFIFVRDRRFSKEKQLLISTLLHDDINGYMNQYGRIETAYDMGSFDFEKDGTDGVIRYYPTKYKVNDYDVTIATYNIKDNVSSIGGTSIGCVDLNTTYNEIQVGTTGTIVGIASTYISSKLLVEVSIDSNKHEFTELSLIHDGTNIEFLEYGQLTDHALNQYSIVGLGTFGAYYSGSQINLDFTPISGIGSTSFVSVVNISLGSTTTTGVGTYDIKHLRLQSNSVSIAASASPVSVVVSDYPDFYEAAYYVLQVSDVTNNYHQISELVVIDDGSEVYFSEFGYVDTDQTFVGVGTIGAIRTSTTQLTFTPNPNIDVEIKYLMHALRYQDDANNSVSFQNDLIHTGLGNYYGTDRDVKRTFDLNYKTLPIFQKSFDAEDSSIVDLINNTIKIPNHFFVTGEKLTYSNTELDSANSIGIGATYFVGIGITDKLPSDVYAIKVNDSLIKLARNVEEALSDSPKVLVFASTGIGTNHSFTSTNQNSKVLIAIDNVIQSPIVSTAITSTLSLDVFTTDNTLHFTGITSFFGGDLIKIGNEIMQIESINIDGPNTVGVFRGWMGTSIESHSSSDVVTKLIGNYNIIDNTLNFIDAPYGKVPTETSNPYETDWSGISTHSSFQGRVFLRSGVANSSDETYSANYIFDDISSEFNAKKNSFTLKSNQSDISGFYQNNAIILVNDLFQKPDLNYTLNENVGITSIQFNGAPVNINDDVNITPYPRGGIIVSVGSTNGFGYQPLVSAGGTAIISGVGTVQSISIGNSGSGYRKDYQVVNVGVTTITTGTPKIEFIGTAIVNGGHVVSIAITNPGSGYSQLNPPVVIFDDPLSYSDLPLIYSSSSSGIGTGALIDVVVGQGSSVISFEIKNYGYGYGQGEILTIPLQGSIGIPTSSQFSEFQISIEKTISDKFTGWSVGKLQILDDISKYQDGSRTDFPLNLYGDPISIISPKGSKIDIQSTLIIFINEILQVPGESYVFNGGSTITFTEPLKSEDEVIIVFYEGTGSVDVALRNIVPTVKPGDELTIGWQPSLGQKFYLQEDSRTVTDINSTITVKTNPYFGPGNEINQKNPRPVTWCKQTEDKIINENEVSKSRELYESSVYPASYLIQSLGIGNTIVYVDNIRPFFDPINENANTSFQKAITIVSQDDCIAAGATATVAVDGTIASLNLYNNGKNYSNNPTVSITNSGIVNAEATAVVSDGIVINLNIDNPGLGYTSTNPPNVLISSPTLKSETDDVTTYSGDSGVIVGFGTTSISSKDYFIFDFHIPYDSYLRDNTIVGTAVTLSSIDVGDYFVVYNSNIGIANTSIYSKDLGNNTIGIGTDYVDNVYQVEFVENVEVNVVGIGTTIVRRTYVKVSHIPPITFDSTIITFDSTVYTFDSI